MFAGLLDEVTYLYSIRTMYRNLETEGEVRERRGQFLHPRYTKPEVVVTGPHVQLEWGM